MQAFVNILNGIDQLMADEKSVREKIDELEKKKENK
jgi:hypothetical protein